MPTGWRYVLRMGFFFRKTKKLGKTMRGTISNRGVSMSKKAGPFSISTRGNASIRLGKGLGFRKKLW